MPDEVVPEPTEVERHRIESLGLIAGRIAHEINNALAYAELNLAVIERELDDPRPLDHARLAKLKKGIQIARDGASRMRMVTRELSDPSSDEPIEVVDVRELVEATLLLMSSDLSGRRVVRDYGAVPHVRAQRVKLGQVVLNLVRNAVLATSGGDEIKLGLAVDEQHRVVLSIADRGVGVPSAAIPHLFEPHFTTRPGVGTGLGLAISRELVRRMGGSIGFSATPGGGATFSVALVSVSSAMRLRATVLETDGDPSR